MSIRGPQLRGVILVAAANILYSAAVVAALGGITGVWTWICMTALGQAAVVLIWLLARHGRTGLRIGMAPERVIYIGVLIAAQIGLYLAALELTRSSAATIVALHLCAPLLYLLAAVALRRRPATARDGLIAICVTAGVALATGASLDVDSLIAMALSLASAGVIALMWLEMARIPYRANRPAVMGWAVLVVAACFAWAPLVDGGDFQGIGGWGWALLVGAVVITPAGFFEWYGVASAGAMLTSLAALIQLPATALLLLLVRGDALGWAQITASALIAAAIALELTRARDSAPDKDTS